MLQHRYVRWLAVYLAAGHLEYPMSITFSITLPREATSLIGSSFDGSLWL